ncbi:Mn-dependent transcriptional regulator (DtxR family) [Halalkaliarchaeum sp. AArc-CO]|uniref:metal-dependent transcriptional regulator n=1 Tax=unclassified Halalkaliarchaeum TaxID=2678344 RepID=UPI00217D39B9|nr:MULTISPECIES: metal-dependent transcriptional regulator [unclassified Halalkaliarchaeum]MDR5672431.1 metal-dependent transcriptional regulator [Halalkaliarchaeum sp. AArc-GB]UWG49935.1 Mn-dependent transcriptional regulator (DtxR family) [Halalkaliarchaeum sp. AArc-CO]
MSHEPEKQYSESVEMYLKEIYLLSRDGEPAKTGLLADSLGVSPPSVTEMVDRLAEQGLATHEKHRGTRLTETGTREAERVLRKHCRIERFLVEQLGKTTGFHEEACRLEHAMSDDVARALDRFVDLPDECPDCYDREADRCSRLFG